MPLHATGDQIEFFDQADIALPVSHHLRFALHRGKATGKAIDFVFADIEHFAQLGHIQRDASFGKHFEDELSTGKRVFVLGLLACFMWIGSARRLVRFIVFFGQNVFRNTWAEK